jgi:hypothetical protein
MANLLDFENEEKGYKKFYPSKKNVDANVGKTICYVTRSDIDPNRGSFFARYGILHSRRYSRLYLNDMNRDIDVRDILDCGIKIDTNDSNS